MTNLPKHPAVFMKEAHPENLLQGVDIDVLAVLERYMRQTVIDESEKLPRWAVWS